MCTNSHQRGFTLIELIVFIVIVSVALVGVLTVFNVTTKSSADPMIRKQMLAIAEAVLEEVMLQPFTWCDPDDPLAATATQYSDCPATRQDSATAGESRGSSTFPLDNVFDYNGLVNVTNSASGTPATVMPAGYSASITVAQAALSTIAATDSLLVTVTVCHAAACPSVGADSIVLEGYRTRHSPNMLP